MADKVEELKATLAQLHQQLQDVPADAPDVKAMLEGAIVDIHSTLDAEKSADEPQHDTLIEPLTDAASRFEESHPTLAGAMTRLVELLRHMGI
ncbi:hypothetical protein Pan216_23160 [Planctomycetes bacterium Pan216]|uniref:DUF4404 domain-containing protein n=1 Tax=Kolteria novifilia TaxID=2527975 RepID=A0A518B3F5_9BACT|nr:hypothetical protein Pan216_23160 [Planctomycetes bacterium Pan216]